MRFCFVLLVAFALFASCGSSSRKKDSSSLITMKQIIVVDNINGDNIAYTEDGHTIVYEKDSLGNFIVYYVKFDIDAEKHGSDRYREKLVRVEVDSTLSILKSLITVYGGAFFVKESLMGYSAYYYDDQMYADSIELIDIPENSGQSRVLEKRGNEIEKGEIVIKRILMLLNDAYQLALRINDRNASGWRNIVSVLEPSHEITSFQAVLNDTIYDQIVIGHISKICSAKERFMQYDSILQAERFPQ